MKEATVPKTVALLGNFVLHRTTRPTNYHYHLVSERTAFLSVAGVWFLLNDNCGEFMVNRLNSGEVSRDVPLTVWGVPLNEATVAARVAAVLRGEAIDYEERYSDADQAIMEEVSGSR